MLKQNAADSATPAFASGRLVASGEAQGVQQDQKHGEGNQGPQ